MTGVRFYKGSTNTGTHVGNLWSSGGTRRANATFTNETASGWQRVTFAAPVAVTANTTYVASYFAPFGGYSYDRNYFANSGVTSGALYLLSNGESGGNGVYRYGSSSGFPTSSYQATNYWVDIDFEAAVLPPDVTPPTVVGQSPAPGAVNVSSRPSVTATFSEPFDPATVGTSTFELRGPSNALVAATVASRNAVGIHCKRWSGEVLRLSRFDRSTARYAVETVYAGLVDRGTIRLWPNP